MKAIKTTLTATLVLLVILVAVLAFFGFTQAGTRLALNVALPLIRSDNLNIEIDAPGALLSENLSIGRIAIADVNGTWLEINDLHAIWSPATLLRGTVETSSLTAKTIKLTRLPKSGNSDSESSGLLIGLDINGISLPEIALDTDFTGKEEQLALKGRLGLNRNRAFADLTLTDRNRGNAQIDAKLDYDVAANQLALDTSAIEANGGFVSSLLQLPGNPALFLNVAGKGPLDNWKAEASGSLEGVEVVRFNATYATPQSGETLVSLSGGGALDALLPPALEPLFAGSTQIDISARMEEDGTIAVQKGDVETGAVKAVVSGTFSPEGQNDLKADISAVKGVADFNFLTETGGWRAYLEKASITVSGPAEQSDISIAAQLQRLDILDGAVEGIVLSATSRGFDLKNRHGAITTSLSAGASRFSNENLDRLIQAPLALNTVLTVDGDLINTEEISLQSASVGGTASGGYDLAGKEGSANFKLFAAPLVLPPAIAANLTETTRIEGRLNIANGGIELPEISIGSQLMTAQGSVSLEGDNVAASLSGNLPDLAIWRDDLQGAGEFSAKIDGTLAKPEFSADLSIDEASVSGLDLRDFSSTISGAIAETGAAAALRVEGSLNEQTIRATANLQQGETGGYKIPDIQVDIGKNQITGTINISKQMAPDGQFRFDLPDLALLSALAGQTISGDLTGTASIADVEGQLTAKVDAEGGSIAASGAVVEAPGIHITTEGALISGTVETAAIIAGDNRIEKPKLTFDRDGDNVRFAFDSRYDGAPAEAEGRIRTGAETAIWLDKLTAKPRGIAIALKKPAVVTLANGGANIEEAAFSIGGGSLTLGGAAGDTLALRADLSAIPASLINTFASDLGAAGSISGTVQVSGPAGEPLVNYALRLENGSVTAMRSLGTGSISVSANGRYQQNSVSLDLSARGAAGLAIDGGGNINLANRTLSLRFSGPVPASLLNGATARQGMSFSGNANSDISVAGSLASPQIGGLVRLDNVGVDLVRQNIAIRSITGEVRLEGDTARLVDIQGRFTNGGAYTASGTIGTSGAFPANLTINLNGVNYTDGALVAAELGGSVNITGNLVNNPSIAGTINIAAANITIPETLPASIAEINLQHKNASAAVAKQYSEIAPDNSGDGNEAEANLSLTINAPRRIFVRGRGMDAELGGQVRINGTTANPIVSGGFELIRGRLSVLGKRLDFTSGSIGFAGGLIPDLDLQATTTAGSTTIIIGVSGPANAPQFSFSSSPSLPEDEVLAQLVFQRSSSNLSPFQIAQLADAAAQLTGVQSSSIFTRLRKAGGLDNLDVTADDEGNAEVKAGKYLNSKTYIELQQNTGTGDGKAIINLDVGGGVKLRGEAASDGEGAAGIFYEKEY